MNKGRRSTKLRYARILRDKNQFENRIESLNIHLRSMTPWTRQSLFETCGNEINILSSLHDKRLKAAFEVLKTDMLIWLIKNNSELTEPPIHKKITVYDIFKSLHKICNW